MTMTLSRLLSLAVVALSLGVIAVLSSSGEARGLPLAMMAAAFGLTLVWFPAELAETGFQRGVLHSSPPSLVAAFGWLFLIGYPLLLCLLG